MPIVDHAAGAAVVAAAAAPALDVRAVVKRYGTRLAVDAFSLQVHGGEIVGLLGPNGAGKTTTINMILGLLTPDAGSVHIAGLNLAEQRSAALAQVNFQASYAPLPGNLTVRQNLHYFGRLYALRGLRQRVDELLEAFDLRALADTRCGVLSSGEQARAALAKALINRPRLLLLDEPTASLDPATADDLRRLIRTLTARERCAVLWTSHNMLEVEQVCDRVLLLAQGRVLLAGDPRALPALHGAQSLEALFIRIARQPLHDGDMP